MFAANKNEFPASGRQRALAILLLLVVARSNEVRRPFGSDEDARISSGFDFCRKSSENVPAGDDVQYREGV